MSFKDQKVMFEDASGKEVIVDYDLLIAADGAYSNVRNALVEYDKDLNVHVTKSERSYVGVDGLRLPDNDRRFILF